MKMYNVKESYKNISLKFTLFFTCYKIKVSF
nr:MAG TPA: hypothetical protein [Caudoviricetes sp.]DAR06301.1 MAG TPA: hypothetical protein [Caudoviricetes sp.]